MWKHVVNHYWRRKMAEFSKLHLLLSGRMKEHKTWRTPGNEESGSYAGGTTVGFVGVCGKRQYICIIISMFGTSATRSLWAFQMLSIASISSASSVATYLLLWLITNFNKQINQKSHCKSSQNTPAIVCQVALHWGISDYTQEILDMP